MVSVRCLLVGHDDMLVREADRMWLQCHRCNRNTPGWQVGRATAPAQQPPPDNSGSVAARWSILEEPTLASDGRASVYRSAI